MKKFLFLLIAGTMVCGGAYAKHDCDCSDCRAKMERKMMTGGRGGFVDAAAKPLSVAEVQKLSDDAYVTMEGYITKRLSDDEYNFTDGTNNVTVEIDDKDWRGLKVTPKDKIIVNGKVDKDLTSFKVEVKSLTLAN